MTFYSQGLSWHEGEEQMHKISRVPVNDNPTVPFLAGRYAAQLPRMPLMAIGTLDADGRPWTTLWGGEPPFCQPVAQNIIGIRTTVDAKFDPVVDAIYQGKDDGEVMKEDGEGRLISALPIDLETRNRIKLAGRIVAGGLNTTPSEEETTIPPTSNEEKSQKGRPGQIQLVLKIDQSMGNCPKYLNKKHISPSIPSPVLSSNSALLPPEAIDLISRADLFFISSSHSSFDMDTNHRGGPPGFIRTTTSPDTNSTCMIWPEYSGNNLYQTLGNLLTTPYCGLCIPDFATGDVVYVTGTTDVLIGDSARKLISSSNLAVKLIITSARYVKNGLPFRGTPVGEDQGHSPYNPKVRYLTTEKKDDFADKTSNVTAKLVKKTSLTPTISRYRFKLSDAKAVPPWKPGQYVALDFSEELDMGYSHMNDHDPRSLNDNFIRTFTVTSPYGKTGLGEGEFEVTVRKVGSVTGWLGWQRVGAEVGVKGFAGEYRFNMSRGGRIGFVAQGIGITPLMGQMDGKMEVERLKVFWSVGVRDIGIVRDLLTEYPDLVDVVTVFLTGSEEGLEEEGLGMVKEVMQSGLRVERRRMTKEDLVRIDGDVNDWYVCTAPAFKDVVQQWLPGRKLIFEEFNY